MIILTFYNVNYCKSIVIYNLMLYANKFILCCICPRTIYCNTIKELVVKKYLIVFKCSAHGEKQLLMFNEIILSNSRIGSGSSHFGSGTLGLFKPISRRNLISYSIKLYQQLQEMGHDIGLRQCGSIYLAQSKDRMVALKRRMAYNVPTGLHCEVYNLAFATLIMILDNY